VFSRNLFSEFDHLQRQLQQSFDLSPSIRGWARGGYPAMNVGTTPQSVEVDCFVPGVDPNAIDVQIEKGVLSISGERKADAIASADQDKQSNLHIEERFAGKFRRVVTLPDDADADAVTAQCRDGVLHISVQRRKAAQARRIAVQ
jgi:HSP20 family protein